VPIPVQMRGTASNRIKRSLIAAAASLALGLSAAPAQASLISPQAVARLRAIAGEPSVNGHAPVKPLRLVKGHKVG
jgi:hypothetical protein